MTVAPVAEPGLAAPTQTLQKALGLLEMFKEPASLSLSELARLCGGNKSSVHRLVRTLEITGYLTRDPQTGRYSLGLKLFELGTLAVARLPVRQQAFPLMTQLSLATGESVFLSVPLEGASVCVEEVVTSHTVWIGAAVGVRSAFHATAAGKCFLAFIPSARERLREQIALPAFTSQTRTDGEALQEELDRVLTQGWALNDEETELGVRYVAAPIRDGTGQVVAALSLGVAIERLPREQLPAVAQRVVASSREISLRLGYGAGPLG